MSAHALSTLMVLPTIKAGSLLEDAESTAELQATGREAVRSASKEIQDTTLS